MTTEYQLTLHTPFGVPLLDIPPISLEYARKEMEVGAASIVLDGSLLDYKALTRDMILTIHRSVDGRPAYLAGKTIWFLRHRHLELSPNSQILSLGFEDANTLLNRRVIAYFSDVSQTDKEGQPADNIMRAIVRENLGSSATDATRNISTYLSVQADLSLGANTDWMQAWTPMIQELKNLAAASYNLGTYLTFDVEVGFPPNLGSDPTFNLIFSVYKTMRGVDHSLTAGTSPILIGPDFGNMTSAIIDDDWSSEVNHIYAGGEGDDSDRLMVEVSNATSQNAGPMSRYELLTDHSDIYVSNELTTAGNADLAKAITKTKITGDFKDSEGVKWGVDVNYGDYVTAQVKGYSVDCRLNSEHITWNEAGEALDIKLEGTLP